MSRKKISSPRKKMRMLHVATLLPVDPQALYTHCMASWTGIKARFTTVPTNTVDADLLALNTALGNGPGGSPADTAVIVVAAAKVRQDWKQVAAYVEGALLAGPIEAAPAILAEILMYESKVGLRAPKPELQAKQPERHAVGRGAADRARGAVGCPLRVGAQRGRGELAGGGRARRRAAPSPG